MIKGKAKIDPEDLIETVLDLSEDEEIAAIDGCCKKKIVTRLYIITSHGRYIEHGEKGEGEFKWLFKSEMYFHAFQLGTSNYISYMLPLVATKNPKAGTVENPIKSCPLPNTTKASRTPIF